MTAASPRVPEPNCHAITTTSSCREYLATRRWWRQQLTFESGFILWPEEVAKDGNYTQAEVYFIVASLLQHLRAGARDPGPVCDKEQSLSADLLAPEISVGSITRYKDRCSGPRARAEQRDPSRRRRPGSSAESSRARQTSGQCGGRIPARNCLPASNLQLATVRPSSTIVSTSTGVRQSVPRRNLPVANKWLTRSALVEGEMVCSTSSRGRRSRGRPPPSAATSA